MSALTGIAAGNVSAPNPGRASGRARSWRFVVVLCCIGALVAAGSLAHRLTARRFVPLHAYGLALAPDGSVVELREGDTLIPGTRVLRPVAPTGDAPPGDTPAGVQALAASEDSVAGGAEVAEASADHAAALQQAWLAAGRVPAVPQLSGSDADLVSSALLDLQLLTRTDAVTVAGWSPAWHYVWPRDSALVAAAFARTGHEPEALALLDFLDRVQPEDGVFQARYRTDGSVPDDRGVQLDGTGWVLWGLQEAAAARPAGASRTALLEERRGLLDRSVAAIDRLTVGGTSLPPASADYWEVRERRVTLATCAALLAGLRSARDAYADLEEERISAQVSALGDRFERVVLDRFADDGFPRRVGGSPSSVDLGVALLLAPFARLDEPRVLAAWRGASGRLARPAGGLAPGGSWRRDGISWTPTTATWALSAACVDPEQALDRLRWLARHRTASGALPEKVLADGSPAEVAPLAWTAAAVVLTADRLERGC